MELVYDNAVALTDTADYSFASPLPAIKRAALCDAVKAASAGTFTCATPAAYAGTPVSLNWSSLDPGFAATPVSAPLATASSLSSAPGGESQPWVTSQPGAPSCTTCVMKARTAYLGTNPPPATYTVHAGVITVKTKEVSGALVTENYSFTPPAASATNATNYNVALGPSTVAGIVMSATVTWTVTGPSTYQTTSPLTIVP
jgi:hypothetical protein